MDYKSLKDAENCEMSSFMDSKNTETMTAILNLISDEPRGLTITNIALHMKLNRNTVRKYTLMLSAGGYIEERKCGHTKVFNISNRVPLTSVLDYAMEGVVIINEKQEISYFNSFLKDSLNLDLKDLRSLLLENQVKDGIKRTAITGFTDKKIEINTAQTNSRSFKIRFVSANCFNGGKKTVIYLTENKK